MNDRKNIIIAALAIWALVATVLVVKQKPSASNQEVIAVCTEALRASSDLTENCSAAYEATGECASYPDACDYEQTLTKVEQLNEEKITIEARLDELIQKLMSMK